MEYLIIAVIAYLIGSIMPAIILTKKFKGFDIREKGSNNAGTTNVIRTAGFMLGALSFLLDLAKGSIAVLVAILISKLFKLNTAELMQFATIFVVLGHTLPIYFGFKGGKGVATAFGALLVISPAIAGILAAFALTIILVTKMVSVASIASALLLPILFIFVQNTINMNNEKFKMSYIVFAVILSAIVIINHRTNIKRLYNGEENKLSFGKGKNEN